MILQGKSLYLRPLELNDAEGNYPNWLNDPIVCKYNSHGEKLYTKEMAKEYINSVQNSSTFKVFAICMQDTHTHIGNISLQDIKNQTAEFAILLGEVSFMGKGYSKEAGKLILEYGFNTLSLQNIHCGTSEKNIPMQKLATYLGMKNWHKTKSPFKKWHLF